MSNPLPLLSQNKPMVTMSKEAEKALIRLGIKVPRDSAFVILKTYYVKFCELYDNYDKYILLEMVNYYEKQKESPFNRVKRMVNAAPNWKSTNYDKKDFSNFSIDDGTKFLSENFS